MKEFLKIGNIFSKNSVDFGTETLIQIKMKIKEKLKT